MVLFYNLIYNNFKYGKFTSILSNKFNKLQYCELKLPKKYLYLSSCVKSSKFRLRNKEELNMDKYFTVHGQNKPNEKDLQSEVFFGSFHSSKRYSPEVLSIYKKSKTDFKWYTPIDTLKKYIKMSNLIGLYRDQRYIDERVNVLGYDLAAAHFIIYRNGSVKFKGMNQPITFNKEAKCPSMPIPRMFDERFIIEEIDLSNLPIVYDGLMNLDNLRELKVAKFSNCPYFDDWCMDRICGQNYLKLEHLDISHCKKITDSGVSLISKFRSLKVLNVEGIKNVENLELLCLMLEECLPGLEVRGLSFPQVKQTILVKNT